MFLPLMLLIITEINTKEIARIYKGYTDFDNKYPFVVALERKHGGSYVRYCTGSLIRENWVITAAHCLKRSDITVTYGNRLTRIIFKVKSVLKVIHPDHIAKYNQKNWTILNDIGLIKVERIPGAKLGTISAEDYRRFLDLPVLFAGFGLTWLSATSSEEQDKRKILYYNPLMIGEGVTIKCDNKNSTWHPSICVGVGWNGSSARYGDSGGPLLHKGTIIGISSGLRIKQSGDHQMVFVPIGLYVDWIRNVIAYD